MKLKLHFSTGPIGLARDQTFEAFSRFLTVAGLSNGAQLNFTKIGSDAQVPPRTVRDFFSVLEDTLVGFHLAPFQKTMSRKPVATAKFYFFDCGVAHALQGIKEIVTGTPPDGRALEHLVALELRAFLSYRRIDKALTYWRTTSQLEVDFVIGNDVAIEVKGTGRVSDRDAKGIRALAQEVPLRRKIIVCNESDRRLLDAGIEVFPLQLFLSELWEGRIV